MPGRVCLITGATSGIGKAAAHALAALGASVGLIGRDPQKGEATVQRIRQDTGNEEIELLSADLTSQTSIRELADHILTKHDQLHLLVNCAGAFFRDRRVTIDGLEMTFALNHLAYFLLTTLLLDLLQESAPARVVNVTSGAHSTGRIDFEDLQGGAWVPRPGGLQPIQARQRAVHLRAGPPARRNGRDRQLRASRCGAYQLRSPESAGRVAAGDLDCDAVHALTGEGGGERRIPVLDPEVETVTGKYFHDLKPKRSSKLSHDPDVAARLWQVSEELTARPRTR
jgi:hypothetical protein